MALDVRSLYCKIVNGRYDSKSHPYWPGDPAIQLGDYGTFDGLFFDKIGNIFAEQIVLENECPSTTPSVTTIDQIFTHGCQYGLKAGGEMGNAVTVQIDFASNESLLIHMHNLKTTSINGLKNLQDKLNVLHKQNSWNKRYVVITELVIADNLHYYAYAGGKGTIDLKANVSPSNFNIKQDFGQLAITAHAGIKTDLFHESTFANEIVFVYKARKLVKPILDLLGSPKLEVQAAANEFSNGATQNGPLFAEDLILGEI